MFKLFNQNKLLKVLSLNSFSVAISFVLGILSTRIISIYLGSSGMALMGSFRNFSVMIKSIATIGLSNSIVKLFVENKSDKKELSIIYSTFFWILLLVSFLLTSLVLLFSETISIFLFYSNVYKTPIQFLAIVLPLMVINTFWLAIYNGLEKFKSIVIIQIISNVLVFLVTALLIWKQNILGGLLSIAIGELIMVIVTFLFVIKNTEYFKFDLQKVISGNYFKVIKRFILMALLSAVIAPLTLILIRNTIVQNYSINEAGVWDAVNRFSSFYMLFFNTGLSLYYMPKLASLNTDEEFKTELKSYFKTLVPLFIIMLFVIFLCKALIIKFVFSNEFSSINELLIWQLAGDFIKVITLAFGFQIVVKTMMKNYFIGEIIFNLSYFVLSYYLLKTNAVEGVLQAYFCANVITLILFLFMFRKLFYLKKKLIMTKLLCIIPFFNEEFRFSSSFEKLFQQYSDVDFLLVDDGSSDNTNTILQSLSINHQNCAVLSLSKNVGKAEAIRNGVLKTKVEKYNFIGYLDADLATPINEFIKLYDLISLSNSVVFIMGSRIKLIGNKVERSLLRHYLGRVFATIVSHFILKTPVYDTQCGAKIINAKLCASLFEKPFQTKWLFDVELLLRLKKNGNNLQNCVAEIPLYEWKEIGNSKIKISDFVKVPFQLGKLYFDSTK